MGLVVGVVFMCLPARMYRRFSFAVVLFAMLLQLLTFTPLGVEVNGKMVPGLLAPERIKAATPPPGQAPTFIALGGRGGSGKSSLNGLVYEESRAIVLDADHIKGMLPEYEGWNAHQVHEESSHVLESVLCATVYLTP